MMDNPLDAIYWRDEILQIMFWFRGEGLGEAVTSRDLLPFLNADLGLVQSHMELLVMGGYVTRLEGVPVRYRLSEMGVTEGGRRFADEFAGLTGQGHGECNNPNCSCHELGSEACAAHTPHQH